MIKICISDIMKKGDNMVYLDYSATTPVDKDVLKTFCDVTNDFIGNPNSLHKLGVEAKNIIDEATEQIANILKIKNEEIIYTSCASESNNMAIKGICLKYKNRGNHIITTNFEHSSIYGPISSLQKEGFKVSFVDTDEFGRVDLTSLKELLTDETILVSIGAVNSEIGIVQPILEIGDILKEHKCFFHVDMTQMLGKEDIDLTNIDLASFAAHKIYGIKGIGMLFKRDKISLEPLINGGKSTTIFRSGTPMTGLIVSFSKAIRLITENLLENKKYITQINNDVAYYLSKYENVYVNSNKYCVPNILNVSIVGVKPETMLHALEKYGIYISTQTACSSGSNISKSVFALTKNEEISSSSIRISLSHFTTKDEIEYFKKHFDICYKELRSIK